MLSLLHIENIAVISRADIAFGEGLNVLTGETGAGKSIVIDAIGAIIGQRTSRDLIRTGAKSAQVSALFQNLPDLAWFRQEGLGPDENGELLLERSIQADGKNVCRVNGRPVLVTQLRALGCQLLNIHGQHDGQQLLDESCHLDYLDSFGGLGKQRQAFAQRYERVRALRGELERLAMDEGEKARRVDTLRYQIDELERAQLREGEEQELAARRDLLRNAERLTLSVDGAWAALTGGEDGLGAAALLDQAAQQLSQGGRHSQELAQLADRTQELRYEAEDVAESLRALRESMEFQPGELDELEGRLDQLHRLKRKYGGSEGEMLAFLDDCRRQLDQIQGSDQRMQQLQEELDGALAQAGQAAQALSQARRAAAGGLEERIGQELAQLDMPKVRFSVAFAPKQAQDGMDATGVDEVRFLMSANLGEELRPIQRVASGGELARIMLALKNVLAETEQVSTLIFDEVDTGVSGRAADKVARKLFQVAQSKQVLCVTHLPQIAAMGDVHFCVEKRERDGRTYTAVERLEQAQRRQELARLTSGERVTQTALDGAQEMLEQAQAYKAGQERGGPKQR